MIDVYILNPISCFLMQTLKSSLCFESCGLVGAWREPVARSFNGDGLYCQRCFTSRIRQGLRCPSQAFGKGTYRFFLCLSEILLCWFWAFSRIFWLEIQIIVIFILMVISNPRLSFPIGPILWRPPHSRNLLHMILIGIMSEQVSQ